MGNDGEDGCICLLMKLHSGRLETRATWLTEGDVQQTVTHGPTS